MASRKNLQVLATLGLVLIAFCGVFAQPPKGASKILAHTEYLRQDNLDKVVNQLMENGFELEEVNKEYFFVKTAPKPFDKVSGDYYLHIVCKDSVITVSGKFNTNIDLNFGGATAKASYEPIINKGMKGSYYRDTFILMDEFVKLLRPRRIEYL